MNEEEYKNRINKINARLSTDRCSDDEIANLNIQRIYLKDKYIDYLQQENAQLKQDVEKLAHNMTVQDIYNAKIVQQLKDKDEKISKAIEYCNEKLKWNRNDGNDYWAGKNNAEQQVSSDIKNILESNKED